MLQWVGPGLRPGGGVHNAKGGLLKFIRFLGWGNRAVVTIKEVLIQFLAFVWLVKADFFCVVGKGQMVALLLGRPGALT